MTKTELRSTNVAPVTEGFEVLPIPAAALSIDDFMPPPAAKPAQVKLDAKAILKKVTGCKPGHRPIVIDEVLVEASMAGEKLDIKEIATRVNAKGMKCTEDHVLTHLQVWDPVVGVKAQRGIASRLKREGTKSFLDLSDLLK